jgi:ethanolamine utilization protein EutA
MTSDREVLLLGLDFGSTTSSLLLASARLESAGQGSRSSLGTTAVRFQPEPVFTPYDGDVIDEAALGARLDAWLALADVATEDLFATGCLITGLAARRSNAAAIATMVERRFGEGVIARADDPCLESWLAFLGNCEWLSRALPERVVLNLDIGGGTTNPALGRDGGVLAAGSCYVGARHFRFVPGSYRLEGLSPWGERLSAALGIDARAGEEMPDTARDRVLDVFITALEALATGSQAFFANPPGSLLGQVSFAPGALPPDTVLTFSGGVGELVYRLAAGEPVPGTTHWGDLGIDLARRIVASPCLSRDLSTHVPERRGRATVHGVALHATEVSGASVHLPDPAWLPLRDLPVVARLGPASTADEIAAAAALAAHRPEGICLQLVGDAGLDRELLRAFASRLASGLSSLPDTQPVVLLCSGNHGKTLGSYASDWGRRGPRLIVIDELPERRAHFCNLGRPRRGVVPVSFYGIG